MAIFWGYVRQRDKTIQKSPQMKFSHLMPIFSIFHKELLLKLEEENDEAPAPVNTTTTMTPRSKAPLTAQEHAVHQLIDELTKLDSDLEDEVPINLLEKKCFKTTARKAIPADSGESERQQRYKHTTKPSKPN
ncbi:hypothetical protein PVK06_005180 [Gossypium arboreum]|uniref:Uncharacterized protein n=1 Tax=Gossypium arboreum TaxID=29729 RepID=A0ABR0QU00_GOSAR|nr:hypothetical protein PVK06_005180 [Gossypium arboreum]